MDDFRLELKKPHAPRPNQQQVLTNVQILSYGISTFTLGCTPPQGNSNGDEVKNSDGCACMFAND
jgi:hypothetical protein